MTSTWPTRKLRELADIRVSNVDKKTIHGEIPVKLCNYMDVYSNEYVTGSLPFMEASATAVELERFGLNKGDVIITKDSETPDDIGIPSVIVEQIDNLVCGYHLALIRPNVDQVDSIYLAKQLSTASVARFFALHASGSTRYGLPVSTIESVEIPTPPIPEQTKIAELLSAVDRAIEQTGALIAKQQRIKTGLMQDLLTRGIDEHGYLRSEQAHKFKDSPVGRIPVEWEMKNVHEVGSVTLGRQLAPKYMLGKSTTPYLRVANVFDGWIDFNDILEMDFTPIEKEKFFLRSGDVLLNEGQSLELVGRSAIFYGPENTFCFQNTLLRFRAFEDALPTYARIVFKQWLDTGAFRDVSRQTTSVAHLGADRFSQMFFPLPCMPEQERIMETMLAHERQLDKQESFHAKLHSLKTALMQDLLTGKKRVTAL